MVVVLEDEPRHRDVRGQGRGDVSLCWLKDESPPRKRQEGWGEEGQGERGERGGRKSRNTGKEEREREEKPRQDGTEGVVRARTGGTGESKSSRKINQKGADDN